MPARFEGVSRPDITEGVVNYQGEQVVIGFDRNRVTLGWQARVRAAMASDDPSRTADLLAEIIDHWNLTEADLPMPATPANIARLPAGFFHEMNAAITTLSTPSSAEGNASSEPGSTPPSDFTEPAAAPPNGAVTSPSPNVSASPLPR